MAKFCPNCGNGLAEAARFCPGCGTQLPEAQPQPYVQPQSYPPTPPAPPKRKSKSLFIVLGAAGLLVLVIVLVAVLGKGGAPGPAPITRPAITAAETLAPTSTAGPLIGLWRSEDEECVQFIELGADRSFTITSHLRHYAGEVRELSGSYRYDARELAFYGITDEAGQPFDDFSFLCELSGNAMTLDGSSTYDRVAARDVAAVLEDPFAAYPPGGGSEATQPTQPYVTNKPTATTKPPSKGIVGYWRHYYRTLYTGSLGAMTYMNKYVNYSFYDDGTFKHTSLIMHPLVVEGNYSVSGGEIHFTILNTYLVRNNDARDIEEKRPVNNSFSAKYELGTDGNGEYLIIGVVDFLQNTTFDDFSTENAEKEKSRRQTIDYAALHPLDELNHKEPVIMP